MITLPSPTEMRRAFQRKDPAYDGTFIVAEVWSSRADQDAFMTLRLGAALAVGGVTAPLRVRWVPLVAFHQPGA